MTVRIARIQTDEEWEQIRELSKELQLYEESIRPERKPYTQISIGSFLYMQKNVIEKDGRAFIGTDKNGKAIAFMTAWLEDGDGLDQGNNKIGEISDVYVAPEHRNQDIFQSMLKLAAEHFQSLGIERLSLSTLAANTAMHDVCKKIGFNPHKISFELPLDRLLPAD